MAITARQRRALPRSAFALPGSRKYPVPTKAQARRAGIPTSSLGGMYRSALSRAGQARTAGSYPTVARKVRAVAGNRIASVGRTRGTVTRAGYRKGGRRK